MDPNNLRFRINTTILMACFLVSALFITILLPVEMRRKEANVERIQHHLETLYEQNREALSHAIYGRYNEILPKLIEKMRGPHILEIQTYDQKGKLLYTAGKIGEAPEMDLHSLKKNTRFAKTDGQGRSVLMFDASIDLPLSRERVGAIRIVYDMSELDQESRRLLMLFFLLLAMISLLMILLLNFLFSRSVIRPLLRLRQTMQQVHRGKFGEQVDLECKNEIGYIIKIFNGISRQMKELQDQLADVPGPEDSSKNPGSAERITENHEEPFPGIDVEAVLFRLRGNRSLLEKLLKEFCRNYQKTSEAVATAVKSGNANAVLSLIHTVKGVAGNLSANGLHKSSLALEQKIRRGEYQKSHPQQKGPEAVKKDEVLAAFEASMQEVLETACRIEADGAAVEEKKALTSADFSELAALLRRNSPRAEACFNGIKPRLKGTGFGSEAEQLDEEIGRFDFKAALKTLSSIEAAYDANGSNPSEIHRRNPERRPH